MIINRGVLRERGDCTVRAVSNAYGISYECAHSLLADAGRKYRCGFNFRKWAREAEGEHFGYRLRLRADLACMTLGRAIPRMQSGRFIVRHARHVFAVVDGRIYNGAVTPMGLRIKMVYEAVAKP